MDINSIPCPNCGRYSLALRGFEKPTVLCKNNYDGFERQGCYGKFVVNSSLDETVELIQKDVDSDYWRKRKAHKKVEIPSVAHAELDFY